MYVHTKKYLQHFSNSRIKYEIDITNLLRDTVSRKYKKTNYGNLIIQNKNSNSEICSKTT